MKALLERIRRLVAWAMATRLGRTIQRYTGAGGPLLAQGLAYQSIFALFAALWVTFSIAGLWITGDSPLREAIVSTIASAVPGLIDTGSGGAIDLEVLLSARIFGWTGAIAAIGLLWTALGWFGAARSGMRSMLGRPLGPQRALLLKLADLALALAFGIAVLVSASLSLLSTSLLGAALGWVGIADASPVAQIATRVAGLAIAFVLDLAVLFALYRVLAPNRLPRRPVLGGAALAALGLGVLKALGGSLLGGASSNPLLASFAVIVGLLIWFNFVCQVLLIAAAWIAEAPGVRAAVHRGRDEVKHADPGPDPLSM